MFKPTKLFDGVPRFSDLERHYACYETMEYEQLACCVRGYYAAVGELLACKKGTEYRRRYVVWQ